jgi:uncharacterized membrane protein YoaK (UPF0700 family)
MLQREGQRRSNRENVLLAFALAGVAGAVNAVGWLEFGVFTSHVSGHFTRVADGLARGDSAAVWKFLPLVIAFAVGAMTATVFVESARLLDKARYAAVLLMEALLLTVFAATSEFVPEGRYAWLPQVLGCTLTFAMGLQNALVTKLSGAVVRTTHLTGMITDLSIEAVRIAFYVRERMRGQRALERLWRLSRIAGDAELAKARLHLTIIGSFTAAGVLGGWSYARLGRVAMALPVAALVVLVVADVLLTLRRKRRGQPAMPEDARVGSD